MVSILRNTSGKEVGSSGTRGEEPDTIFENFPPAQFTVAGVSLAFPVLRIQESGGNRIAERERPYRDGAKLDDIGSKAKRWTIDAIFNNSVITGISNDQNINAINGGSALYPDVLGELIANFDIHQTGDLVIPTVGIKRVRAESYTRTESMDERDQAIVTFVFVEDNEDNVDFRSINPPTGGANGIRLAQTTEFDTQSIGSFSDGITQAQLFLFQLEELVNGPGNIALDIEAAAMRVEGSSRRAIRTFSEASRFGRNLFLDPQNSRGIRKLTIAIDLAARERNRARRGQPELISIVFRDNTSIFRIAAIIGQDPADLVSINPDLDPNFIPKNTPVKVFVTEALLNGNNSTA